MSFQAIRAAGLPRYVVLLPVILVVCSCGKHSGVLNPASESHSPPAFSEPESYSATVIQTIEDGDRREVSETKVARSSDLFREEWSEAGESRTAIWRPDLGKLFLLAPERRQYVEMSIGAGATTGTPIQDTADSQHVLPSSVEPDRVETRLLPATSIEGHSCTVVERQSSYPDGHTETTRTYSATDLGGLPLRIESETLRTGSLSRILVERKNVETTVREIEFSIPVGFKRVTSL